MNNKFQKTITLIDEANRLDPNLESSDDGTKIPKELLYSKRMADMLQRYQPQADDLMGIAVRAQHIQRWLSPRNKYPMNRQGYHLWRTNLYKFHADVVGKLMATAGYDEISQERVKMAVAKKNIKKNIDSQLVEDVASLVFLEYYLLPFYQKFPQYDEDKWLDIIRKTWRKLSDNAHKFVLDGKVKLPENLKTLVIKAVA
jgi:hypothetical protein